MTNKPIKISENCWKCIDEYGAVLYTKTSDPDSELHREDGPALERAVESIDGYKAWYINGKRHRTDGPAIEWSCGDREWYYNDQFIDVGSQEEFEIYIKNIIFI